jgi:hypothetical protein
MNLNIESRCSGKLSLQIIRKGVVVKEYKDIPNLVFNSFFQGSYNTVNAPSGGISTYTSTDESYEDLPGTWSQSGNTVTRTTGAGTFPASPSQIGNLIQWATGERCYVTARASDTSITVSGPARTITGQAIRRHTTNGTLTRFGSAIQTSASVTGSWSDDLATGVRTFTKTFNFNSATSGYTLGSLIVSGASRIKLPTTFVIEAEDQIQGTYIFTHTHTNRDHTFNIGSESSGIPQKYTASTIVGNGTYVDVTFSAPTHFLAGDKLLLSGVIPKRISISSASSNSTTMTINTTTAHGLSVSDVVVIAGASVAGYNGTFTVASVVDSDTITITDAANPGAMGASGTIRLQTPGTYFDDLGLATIASMPSSSVARITSAITGPASDPMLIGGDPGVRFVHHGALTGYHNSQACLYFTEANVKAIIPVTQTTLGSTASGVVGSSLVIVNGDYTNDFISSYNWTWNAGTGTGATRIKQFYSYAGASNGPMFYQVTLNTPFTKATTDRLRITISFQMVPDLPAWP